MSQETKSKSDDSNSILIRLMQIKKDGIVKITNDDISVFFEFSDNTSSFAQSTTTYKRMITFDELASLSSAIDLLPEKDNNIYDNYKNCYEEAKKFQKELQKLYKYGKKFVYEGHKFFDLIGKDRNILKDVENLHQHISNICKEAEFNKPPFLTTDNLLYFGSLIQKKENKKIREIVRHMFPFHDNLVENAIEEAQKKEYIIDPVKSSIQMFSYIYKYIAQEVKYPKNNVTNMSHNEFDNKFELLQQDLQLYFSKKTFLVIKVKKPVETFHVLSIISTLLYNNPVRVPYFFDNFFCFEDSNIESYFNDLEDNIYQMQTQYSFIIHPELLSSHNMNILKDKIVSRLTPIPNMNLQKYVVITTSNVFDEYGKLPEDIKDEKTVFTLGEIVMKVNANILREYAFKKKQLAFDIRIIQSLKAGEGKTMLINSQIEEIIKKDKSKYRVHHHFIVDSNQPIPIESFKSNGNDVKNIIHFQFSDEIMKKGIKFWSYLYQLHFYGFFLPANKEPVSIQFDKTIIFFEIPQLQKNNKSTNKYPLRDLSDFPIPVSKKKIDIEDTKLENHKNSRIFIGNKDKNQYYISGIECVLDQLTNKKSSDVNLDKYIREIFSKFFNPAKDKVLVMNFRKLGFIEKYLHKYTKLYINSLPGEQNEINIKQFVPFFYALTVTAFYAYDCLPRKKSYATDEEKFKDKTGKGISFLTVDNLFNAHTSCFEKKIHFYTTKSQDEFFKAFKGKFNNTNFNDFTITFSYSDKNINNNTVKPQDILRNIFSSNNCYKKNVELFKKENPGSYIARTQVTVPILFRSSIILNRIFLSQPIILSGDTGCGKTSALMLLFEYFKLPYNKQNYSLNVEVGKILNCHGGVVIEDVINHLKEAPKNSKKHIIFFDELNTSPASSYIEHLLLNESLTSFHCKFVFIGALNPWKEKNQISYHLTKVGLPQLIRNEERELNLIESINNDKTCQNMSEMMYHVHRPQKATDDIVFDFNPLCYEDESESQILYPDEERNCVYSIIDSMAKYPTKNRDIVLNDLKNRIDDCIKFIRELMKERAVISYRDIGRSMKIYNFLFEYYFKEEQAFTKLRIEPIHISLITAIISFVLRLPNHQIVLEEDLNKKDKNCSESFKKVFEKYFGKDKYHNRQYKNNENNKKDDVFFLDIRDQLISILSGNKVNETKKMFMKFVYQYTFDFLKKKNIWKFRSTFIHLFIMDICIQCKLPCFVIGMPGTSKSYAVELLKDHYKDKMYLSTYMSSRTSSPDGIKSQYYDAIYKEIENEKNGKSNNLYVVFIDEMGNANINPSRPLKFLHGILDHGLILNETGYSKIVPTIGVSNYTMDFANMNRGVLVYTDLPDIGEILKVFEYYKKDNTTNINIPDVSSFINTIDELNLDDITKVFQNLWPGKKEGEFGMPETIALRSVYNIRFLIDKVNDDNLDVHNVCQILRELYNSKRLGDKKRPGNYKDLMKECPKNIVDIYRGPHIDNMLCFLERIGSNRTKSKKSLCLFTKNYEAIEYLSLFDEGFIGFLNKQYNNEVSFSRNSLEQFKYYLFAENFKERPDQISQFALEKITECIKSKDKDNIIFIGNNPCFDSCLDLLNVPHSMENIEEREVTLGSGFSSKFKLTNLDFYIIMIANISDIQNNDTQDNPFSYAFLDRTEAVYLDWETIAPYYIKYIKNKGNDDKKGSTKKKGTKKETPSVPIDTKPIIDDIQKLLNNHVQYNALGEEYLHSDIQSLFDDDKYKKANFGMNPKELSENDIFLNNLIQERWNDGIKAVILTKSKILEDLYYPTKFEDITYKLIIKNDSNIQNFEELQNLIDIKEPIKEILIIIRCSKFDELHFIHLKTFFDQMNKKKGITYHFFIVYYGCDTKCFTNLSTFRWPILSMEDISKHPELGTHMSNSETEAMIKALNVMKEDIPIEGQDYGRCEKLFRNIFEIILRFTEKDVKEKTGQDELNFYDNYKDSDFSKITYNFFKFIQSSIPSFYIPEKNNSIISSNKSLIISTVYDRFSNKLAPFILFAFGSPTTKEMQNNSKLVPYLEQCKYLTYPYLSFLKTKSFKGDVFYFLFLEYIQFLYENQLTFNEEIKTLKCISDRIIFIIDSTSHTDQLKNIFNEAYQNTDKRITNFIHHNNGIFDLKSKVVSFQSYVDAFRFRSFAGLHVSKLTQVNYWTKFFICSLFDKGEKEKYFMVDVKTINDTTIYEAIVGFRNKLIFDIFKSPIIMDENFITKIIKHMTSSIDFNEDKSLQLFKDFNKDKRSLKDESRLRYFNEELSNDLVDSMYCLYALNKWNTDKADGIKAELSKDKVITKANYFAKSDKLIKDSNDFTLLKFINFANCWDDEYSDFEWNFKDELTCNCLIDEIQSICSQSSVVKPKFRKWLLSGYEKGEPLSIIALRRYLKNQSEENKKDLAYVIDPFFGNINFADNFINDIKSQIKDDNIFPFNDFVTHSDSVMKNINFRSIFKVYSDPYYYNVEIKKPIVSQIIWFHSIFLNPTKYPLISLLITESSFFIDFHPVPQIINSLLHLRHIFSYNPTLIPIILHCTSLFRNGNRQLLFNLNCFNISYNGKKVFDQIQNELDTLKKVLDLKSNFSNVINKSSYEQIKFILQIYFENYNRIIKKIDQIVLKSSSIPELRVFNLLPNMLLTHFSLDEILTQIIYNEDPSDITFSRISNHIASIFEAKCFKPLANDEDNIGINTCSISLFIVDYNFDERDFLGYTQRDYIDLYRTIQIQTNGNKKVLLFNLRVDENNKELDDIQKFTNDDQFANDNIQNVHLNTYNDDNFYIKSIFGENADTSELNKFLTLAPASFIDEVEYYQEGDLDKPNPNNDDLFFEEEEEEN
ncbi:hypothetical protein M9Y10_007831 [Tritrichomonas musculus]|uniref:ATPase AAA-type core domain-containing protein n=1 Tax=Tritrichomonas musculus TaxID=1915356 RepID=A0ABR2J2E9_9EUKA